MIKEVAFFSNRYNIYFMEQFLRLTLRIAKVIFALSLLYFALRLASYHYHLVIFPYSNTLREGAMMTSTDALVKGLNPYDMSLQPRLMNQYGIIYPLLTWPLAKLFGTTILVHRTVIAFCILTSCSLIFFVFQRMSVPILLNIWAVLMFYSSLLYQGTSTPTIDPGAVGTLFFLLTIFIPWFCKYSNKSLILSVIFGILAFYSKMYTFLGAFVMASYLFLFVSKKKAVLYGFLLLIFLIISIELVNHIFPAYFDNCFFAAINMGPSWSSMIRLHEQINLYTSLHKWVFILMGIFFIGYGIKALRDSRNKIKKNILKIFFSFQLFKFKEPLIKLNFPLIVYAGLCSSFVLYMSLGRHSGAMLWYFFQLLSPFILIGAAWIFSRWAYWPLLCVPFLIYNLYIMTSDQNYKCFNENLQGWSEVSKIIRTHHCILNSPLIAPLLIEQHKEVFDNGQAEYFLPGGERHYWMKNLFKADDRVSVQMTLFFYNIRSMVQKKEFDLIILQPSLLPMGVADDIKKYYKFEGQFLLYAPADRRSYALTIWIPL